MHSSDPLDLSDEPLAIQGLTREQKDRLTDVLDRYLSGLENGLPPSREELLKRHPDLAEPLQTYLDGLDELHDVAAGFSRGARRAEAEAAAAGDERRLGDFRLLREIGRGGMGVVYEAEQISLGRRVALKVLPFAAVLDSRQIARFKHEAQAAAQLDHPNIVAVFAVGVERGVHYYAMQLIEGQPLDRALADLRKAARPAPDSRAGEQSDDALNAADAPTLDFCPSTANSFLTVKSANRPEYFRTVARLGIQAAEALHAAHEHGVVHRDIKPSNLLLDADGKLWVTDFGLARCQSDATLTRTGDVVGTARYMSPEQASGQSALVDHRTDVYSLGATLYELLALQPAFPGDAGPALLRRIEQQEPRRLRQLQPGIPADLETVVMKAMAKRREERYPTARDFADDLRRVLEGKPTAARPPTIVERLGKWARRHKRVVSAAAAVCLLAVVGLAAATFLVTREKIKTEQNFLRAEKNFREARQAVDQFGAQLAERLAGVPGAAQVRRDLLRDTLQYYRAFVDQAQDAPALRADLAMTYSKMGMLAGEIGSSDEAIESHENAIRLFEQLVADHPEETDYRRHLGISRNNLALALSRSGRTDDARQAYHDAIRLQQELAESAGEQALSDLALSHANLGLLQSETGDMRSAEVSFHEAIKVQERLLELAPDNPEYLRDLSASFNNLSALHLNEQPERAAELYAKALACQTKAAAARPGELPFQSDVALTYSNLGAARSRAGQLVEAAVSYTRAVELQTKLVRAAPARNSYRHDLAVSFNNLGLTQSKLRQAAAAERSFRQALDLQETLVKDDPRNVELRSSLGGMYNNLGIIQEELQRPADAAKSYRLAVEHQQAASSRAPRVARYRTFLSKHYFNYGRVLRRLGRGDEAARAALARRELWPNDPQHLFAIAEELAQSAKLLAGDPKVGMTARQCAESAVETLRQAAAAGWKPADNANWAESFAAIKDHPGFAGLVNR